MDEEEQKQNTEFNENDELKNEIEAMLSQQTKNIIDGIKQFMDDENREVINTLQKIESEQTAQRESKLEENSKIISAQERRIEEQQAELDSQKQDIARLEEALKKSNEQLEDTRQKLEKEQTTVTNMTERLEETQAQVNEHKGTIDKQKETIDIQSKKLASLELEHTKIQETYKSLFEAYEAFSNLGVETRVRLKNIFVLDSLECFLSACFDWDNIEGLWNYIKGEVLEKSGRDTDKLSLIFRYMFSGYNARFFEPKYILISPDPGTRYNSDEQVILGIRTDGMIQRVCLEGYKSGNGRVINKALVEV
jgi:hypothetical protein